MSPAELQSLPNAGLGKRLLATLYDLFPLFGVAFLYATLAMLIAAMLGLEQTHLSTEMVGDNLVMRADDQFQPALHGPLFQLGLAFSLLGFYGFFWRRSGQTLGMQAWRLRLIDASGHSPQLRICLLRALLGFPALLLGGLGYLWMLLDPKRLAVHDRLTRTRVVQLPKPVKKKKTSGTPKGESEPDQGR